MKFRRILLILAIATLSLTACKKEENPAPTETTAIEETTTGITKEQLITLHEHAESVYAKTPELFMEDADISIIDLPEITDAEIPVSEAITIEEAMHFFAEEYKDYWMSYELQYAINNADGGLPESLYKAMVVAKQVGLVTGEESRWDEALTKNEALDFILRIYESMDTITNADRGYAKAEEVEAPEQEMVTDGVFENEFADYTKTDESLAEYKVTITEQLDTNLYVIKEADILKLDQEGAGAISPVEIGAYLTVTGKTSNDWYEVQWGQSKGYLPADVLSTENPIQDNYNPDEVANTENGMTAQETLDKFEELMGGFDSEFGGDVGGGISQEVLDNATVAPDYANDPW